MSNLLSKIKQNRYIELFIFTFGIILIVIIGWLDFMSGPFLAFSLFYMIPLVMISWFCGRLYGLIAAVISAVMVLIADLFWQGLPFAEPFIVVWNVGTRLILFTFIIFVITKMRIDLRIIRDIAEREKFLARVDPLTDVPNTRFFYEIMSKEAEVAQTLKYPIAFAYIDVDDFKSINDNYGHLIGDKVLRQIGMILKNSLRGGDIVARLGGDEFGIFMPRIKISEAEMVIKRLTALIKIELLKDGYQISVSVGLVSYAAMPAVPNVIIRTADELMYRAKNEGKDRVVTKSVARRKGP